jgi:hypothetical protein
VESKSPADKLAPYLLSYALIGIPVAVIIFFPNPIAIVPTSAMLAAGVSGFAHTSLGSNGNSDSLELESKGDTLLSIFQGLGIKGRFTASVAVFFTSFLLFVAGQIHVYHSFETESAKAKRLSPKPESVDITSTHNWIDKDKPAPDKYSILVHGRHHIGNLSNEQLTNMLEDIAEKGYEWNKLHPLTYRIIDDCDSSSGLCKNPERLTVEVSFADELETGEANVCPDSDLLRYAYKGRDFNILSRPNARNMVHISSYDVNIDDNPIACTIPRGKNWIQLSRRIEDDSKYQFTKANNTGFTSGLVSFE